MQMKMTIIRHKVQIKILELMSFALSLASANNRLSEYVKEDEELVSGSSMHS